MGVRLQLFAAHHPVWCVGVGAALVWVALWVQGAGQAFLGGVEPAGPIGHVLLVVVALLLTAVCTFVACLGGAMVLGPILRRVLKL